VTETPEQILEELGELESEYRAAAAEYVDSLSPDNNVVSIAPGSPARKMWDARMSLIHFIVTHKELGMELDE